MHTYQHTDYFLWHTSGDFRINNEVMAPIKAARYKQQSVIKKRGTAVEKSRVEESPSSEQGKRQEQDSSPVTEGEQYSHRPDKVFQSENQRRAIPSTNSR